MTQNCNSAFLVNDVDGPLDIFRAEFCNPKVEVNNCGFEVYCLVVVVLRVAGATSPQGVEKSKEQNCKQNKRHQQGKSDKDSQPPGIKTW